MRSPWSRTPTTWDGAASAIARWTADGRSVAYSCLTASPAMTVGMGDGRLFLNQADHRAVAPGTSGLPRRSRP